jgi:hypothetical protein
MGKIEIRVFTALFLVTHVMLALGGFQDWPYVNLLTLSTCALTCWILLLTRYETLRQESTGPGHQRPEE